MADAIARRLTELLTPVVEGAGAFLEGIKTTRAGKYSTVRVLVDLPDGPGDLGMDALTEVSRAVSAALLLINIKSLAASLRALNSMK